MRSLLTILLFPLLLQAQTVNDLRPTVTMKEYVDMQVDWVQKYNDAQLNSAKEANELVRLSLQEYKTQNNEWRGQLKDQAATFVTWTALIGWIIALVMAFFSYANYVKGKKDREREERDSGRNRNSERSIMSGDKVEVKK